MITWERLAVLYILSNEKEMQKIYESNLWNGAYSNIISTEKTCLTELYLNLKECDMNLHFIMGW